MKKPRLVLSQTMWLCVILGIFGYSTFFTYPQQTEFHVGIFLLAAVSGFVISLEYVHIRDINGKPVEAVAVEVFLASILIGLGLGLATTWFSQTIGNLIASIAYTVASACLVKTMYYARCNDSSLKKMVVTVITQFMIAQVVIFFTLTSG